MTTYNLLLINSIYSKKIFSVADIDGKVWQVDDSSEPENFFHQKNSLIQ